MRGDDTDAYALLLFNFNFAFNFNFDLNDDRDIHVPRISQNRHTFGNVNFDVNLQLVLIPESVSRT